MRRHEISKIMMATGLILAATVALWATADAKGTRTRFQCTVAGATDISMSARYEIRAGGREKFTTEFEAGPGTGFAPGNRLVVKVKGVKVGSMRLEALVGGDVVGDLNFDTRRQVDAKPFPPNWPANVRRGSSVQVYRGSTRVLGCTLS